MPPRLEGTKPHQAMIRSAYSIVPLGDLVSLWRKGVFQQRARDLGSRMKSVGWYSPSWILDPKSYILINYVQEYQNAI
jgi:hypothetical protein